MKQADDKLTQELPGMPVPKKRGRPPKHSFGAMSAAERQKAYRERVRERLFVLDFDNLSRVALLSQLSQALAVLDDPEAADLARDGAAWTASKIVDQFVTRYKLTATA